MSKEDPESFKEYKKERQLIQAQLVKKGGLMQQAPKPKRFSIAIGLNWRDLWIGFYISKDRRTIFMCPIPCVVIGIGYDAKRRCYGT